MSEGAATYPVATIAKLLMVTERRVQQLVKEGWIPRPDRGRYELAPAVQGYIRSLKETAERTSTEPGGINIATEKARRMKAEADLKEMEVAERRGTLINADEAALAVEKVVGEVTGRLLSNVPVRIAAAAKTLRSETSIKKVVASEISDALQALADTPPADILGTPPDDG